MIIGGRGDVSMSKFLSGLAFGLALFANQAAQAIPILDFGVVAPNPPTASISYAGGASPLVGTGIVVDEVVGIDTPLNNGVVRALTSGLLTFTTGPLHTFIPGTGMPLPTPDLWEFKGGGPITISGDDGLGPGNRTLLSGTILAATVVAPLAGGTFKVAVAAFFNTVDPVLAAYYGLPDEGERYTGTFNLQFNAVTQPDKSFTSSVVLSGDITTSPAPEPGTLALAGVAVVGGIVWRRRRGRSFDAA